jgi:D-arginine dehydrogenase
VAGADFLIIGGGVAGLAAGARLARHGRVVVFEAEDSIGYHSSGRSATFSHFGIGNETVRALTAYSRSFLLEAHEPPVSRISSAVFVATEAMLPALDTLRLAMEQHSGDIGSVSTEELQALFPPLRVGSGHIEAGLIDRQGLRLDSDALLQAYGREVRSQHGLVLTGRRVSNIRSEARGWTVSIEGGEEWSAPILVNAAGAWADEVARSAGVTPLGLKALRRTIIVVDPPSGAEVRHWPFVKTAVDDFYILPESGRLMASPVDEIESDPCDAQPEEYDVALAAAKIEEYTTLPVRRIVHRWAGLRTFTEDRVPVAGFDPQAPGFFWLAGQGGFGLQTAPAMAEAAESLALQLHWPEGLAARGITPEALRPERLRKQSSHPSETRC